jgi:4a-hydroxytetrahydrobiopterin dehydratase
MPIMTEEELREALAQRPGWRRQGDALVREHLFRDYPEALAYLERVGLAAEDWFRHPDVAIVDGNRVRVTIANPNNAGLTEAELRLAARVDEAEVRPDVPRPEIEPAPAGGADVHGPPGLAEFPPPAGEDTGSAAAGATEAAAGGPSTGAAATGDESSETPHVGPVPLPTEGAADVVRRSAPAALVALAALVAGTALGVLLGRRR